MQTLAPEPRNGTAPPAARRGWPIRPLSALAFGLLALVSAGSAFVSSQVVTDQEQRLLERRASEAAALLSQTGGQIQGAFRSLTTVVQLAGPGDASFSRAAAPVIAAKMFESLGVVQAEGGSFRVVAAEGSGLEPGGSPPAAVTATLERAGPGGVFATSAVFRKGGVRHLGFAAVVDGVSPRTLVYGETLLDRPPDPAQPVEDRSTRAFGDLDGGFYSGGRIDPEQAVIVTPGFDGTGRVVTRPVPLGVDQWLLAVSPREPLVGALAQRQPWILLLAGLVTAGLVGVLVEVLMRRRQYADAVVAERTAQLQASLRDLDAAQHRLVAQERLAAIGQLASAVGHELRNPLGVLSNVIYLLGSRLGREDPWIDRQLKTAEREVAASTLIVSDLLQYSRPREPMFGEVDLPDLIEEVLSVAPPPDDITVARRFDGDLPAMRADRDQLRQVLLNLVCNAYDVMPTGGLLALEGERVPEGVRLRVGDTGAGIDDDTRQHLFEPFFTTKAKGIGLGLAVAHRIVDGHGGSLVATNNTGAGASFSVTLPAAGVPAPLVP